RAVLLTGHGNLDKLVYREDVSIPKPASDQVLLQIGACGLNNTDVNTRTAWYSKSDNAEDAAWGGSSIAFPLIQGADAVATVIAVGPNADSDLLNKRVMLDVWIRDPDDPLNMDKCRYFGSDVDGGYAEYAVIDYRNVYPIESDLSNEELATFATSYVTAENMLDRAKVGDGDTVLIPGASGGVGSALVQLANRRGATTVAMASENKHSEVGALGPDALLPRYPSNLGRALHDALGRDTVDVVADVVGGPMFPALIEVLVRAGRYTCSGAIAGPVVELDLRSLYLKDLTFTGATVVPPGTFGRLVSYIEKGEIKPILAETFALKDFVEAQQSFITKQHVGNIVVSMQSD
ncbi:MAG: zinc-binding dehydrogenase, partial [Woeseiaceae bacterium]